MTMSSDDIRLAQGIVTPLTLLTTDSYKVINWSRVSDMPASIDWTASQREKGAQRRFSPSLALGTGKRIGKYSAIIEFFQLTAGMRDYIERTFLGGNGIAVVTCYIMTPNDSEIFAVYQGEMTSPYHLESDLSYTRVNDNLDVNVQYSLTRLALQSIDIWSANGTSNMITDHLGTPISVG